ncbi:unnamed protein product [Spirodela intermedia]|uniref:ABC transporter domain-containing protein n=1 Tax=Spirodela intermedia TaxID=51605 RepID=A0A7I8IDG2_SPIIN|nr:unnamed protein product [Spirodela intermedia]CAA6655435.1 unnamed protein product [Spirodela intermedia]
MGTAGTASLVFLSAVVILLSAHVPVARCQDDDYNAEGGHANNAGVNQFITGVIYNKLSNLTGIFASDIGNRLGFCIKDTDNDWNGAFNFSSDLGFLADCIKQTRGELMQRVCTAAEIKFYFTGFYENGGKSNYLKPNKNCNLTSWASGCEPGWACSVGIDHKIDLYSKTVPSRVLDCHPCCAGFFCPRGITCMIPCPLGAYCPLSKLNKTTGMCDPYHYQLPPGRPNHTCGGADLWADVGSSSELFCPAGFYCPSTTRKVPCGSGHYCRLGSTSQKRCFKKSSCAPRSSNQDITLFGVLLIIALGLLLLIIYNFSDQILTSRERQQAKSREAAARSARETAQARERWKAAKDIAKKHAVGLQTQLSRTFSRKRSMRQTEPMKISGLHRFGQDDSPLPPPIPSSSSSSSQNSKEPSKLTKMMRSLEDNPDGDEGFNLEIGDKNIKKNMPKGKQMHTRSQIFKYAYGQIEKEKALQQQNKNLTFSGVISMATDTDIRTRPMIEIAFKDLTLTLKGKKKNLIRCVTGKIMPGRVTAVMGPSGAGKTTFLNALAGKATGCETTGLVLINGKIESIHSYKKIIGFVPQDDVVHGNLTVEENLWFSARCRLPDDLSKADKVLVVERVIESLGLQPVRDSLVGTRKRVNVGLEMVMEPSLLILDEPTSGLDSASSQLLLRALRREALEGVNIIMVVHHPGILFYFFSQNVILFLSYTLFKMFDDLILLAKGGLTVYHGSVKKVEEYFSSLGISVPERVNPPDHFIDILEGIVRPSTSSGINYKQLPLKWMQHNGYDIPSDMLHNAADGLARGGSLGNASDSVPSIAGELWGDVKCIVELKRDNIEHNFSRSHDLSNRRTPGFFRQVGKQRLREARIQFVDFLILCLAGVCLGTLAKVNDETFGALGYTYTVIAVSLLCKIGALRSFSLEKLHYWRESASGMSSLAYFLSKDTIDHFNTLIKPIVYLSMFYFFNNPRSSITDNYIILVALVYCVTGIAYTFALFFQPGSAQLWSVLLPIVLTLIATQQQTLSIGMLANLCYPKWALEAFVISNAQRYSGVWLVTRCGSLLKSNYDISDWALCIFILIAYGVVFRFLAFFCMVTFQKK